MAPHSSILALKNPTEDPDIVEAGRVVAPLASALTHHVVPFPCGGQIPTALT